MFAWLCEETVYVMIVIKKKEKKKKRQYKTHPGMILHVALLFYQTTGIVFSPKDMYLVCQLSLIVAEGGSSTHNSFLQNMPHSVRLSCL